MTKNIFVLFKIGPRKNPDVCSNSLSAMSTHQCLRPNYQLITQSGSGKHSTNSIHCNLKLHRVISRFE